MNKILVVIIGFMLGVATVLTATNIYYKIKISKQPPVIIEYINNIPHTYMGEFEVTFYTHTGNKTATGVYPQIDRTVATDPKVIPYGSIIYIDGYGAFIAEDTGADIKNNRLDIFVGSRKEAIEKGRVKADVYMIEKENNYDNK